MKKWKIVLPVLLVVALVCLCLLLFLGGKEYTVSFLNEDGTQIHTATYSKGAQLIVPEDPEKEGHSFVGWALNGEKEVYDFSTDGAKTVVQDMEFVAVFAPNSYTVKFVASNGKDVITSESYLYGESFVVPEAPALTGHRFIGWVKQGETTVCDFNADGAKVTKGDVVYVAKYEPVKSKITFTDHDGSVLSEKTYTYGEFFAIPEEPVREGYVFRGWVIAGQTELYDFEAKDAKRVGESDTVFVAIYDKLEIVAGKLVRVGGAAFPAKVTINFGKYVRTVAVAADGSFTTQLPAGKYKVSVALDGYNCLVDTVTVVAGGCYIGEVKLQQTVAKDNTWWNGGEVSVNGTSVTITVKDGDFNKGDSGVEYQIGSPITGADSWKISAHIANGATGMRGFSAGLNDKGQTLFIYVTDTETGFYSWGTVMDSSAAEETRQHGWPLSEEAKKAIAADDGYQLTLVATNLDGAGTGWLTMYVNDIAVLQIENTFVGSGDRSTAGEKVNLSNVELCLSARVTGNTVTYTDYYYVTDAESALTIGTISGKLTKHDGVAMPKYAVVTNGATYRTIPVAADGSFAATVPAGEYRITAEGYTSVDDSISVTAEKNELGEVELRQTLSSSMSWWGGGSIVENGSAATITMPDGDGVSSDVGHEFQIGTSFTGATSWKATAHVAKGAVERRGFSFGTADGKNGTLFLYVDDYNAGFTTWNTFQNEAGENHSWNHPLSSAVKKAMAAENGYDLTLVATNIDGEGTGWLILYVNDIPVLALENTFVSVPGNHIDENVVMDLGNGHISLVMHKNGASATFSGYSYVINQEKDLEIGTASGSIGMMDGSKIPEEICFSDGLISKTAKVNADGTFTIVIPAGEYRVTSEGYKATVDGIAVVAGTKDLGKIIMQQVLTPDPMTWWNGSSYTESGSSVTITPNSGNSNSMKEFNLGAPITNADSWRISATIQPGATYRRGFTIAPAGADKQDEMIFIWIEDGTAGFLTWSTFKDENGKDAVWDYAFDSTLTQSAYELTLVATNIDGAGTGWLSLYVNDTLVMQMENTFAGTGERTEVGDKIDLGNVVLSLAALGQGNTVTFSDYCYVTNNETDLKLGTISAETVKLDGTAAPDTVKLTGGKVRKTVKVNTDGTFNATVPVGGYSITADGYRGAVDSIAVAEGTKDIGQITLLQSLSNGGSWWGGGALTESGNSAVITLPATGNANVGQEYQIGDPITGATSWKVSAHIAKGATGRRGFSVAPVNARNAETLFLWIEDGTAGFFTWSAYADENGDKTVWDYTFNDAVRAATASDDGYTLSLVATNIDGAGTGWLTMYVNDIAVMQIENTFVGTGDRTEAGDKIDLGNVVVSLAATNPDNTVTFSDYYYVVDQEQDLVISTVSGELTKLDNCAMPESVVLTNSIVKKPVSVTNGEFTVKLPLGTYQLKADSHRSIAGDLVVDDETEDLGQIKLLQTLTQSGSWWAGGTLSENGNSATITVNPGEGDSGVEYQIGETITNAGSWRVSTHIAKGASNYRRGFSIAPAADRNGETVFIWIEDGTAGFYTWSTYADENDARLVWNYGFNSAVQSATANADGYDLTLVATNIDGAGTGWLSLYVNDTLVMRLENTFTGTGDRTQAGDMIDLGNVVVSLAAYSPNNTVTFSDYYYRVNEETDLAVGTVSGKVTKLDGTAVPGKLSLTGGSIKKTVKVNADGTFSVTLPVGTYNIGAVEGYRGSISTITVAESSNADVELKLLQSLTADPMTWWDGGSLNESGNSATITPNSGSSNSMKEFNLGAPITNADSWRISATIQPGATYRRGFTIAPAGADKQDEMIFIWIEDGTAGFLTWNTFKDENEADIVWTYGFDSTLTQSAYDLTLVATNIDGAGTGWLSLYVNDTLVMRLENTFVGTGDRTAVGDKIDLGNVVVSLTATKPGNAVTFSDYYYRVNEETDLTVGTVSGKVTKLDGTAVPGKLSLTGGSIKKTVKVNADGTFSVTLPVDTYNIAAVEGYRGSISTITVAESNNADVELKLLQNLTHDYTWWGGGSKSESGNSATITLNQTTEWYNYDIGHEYQIGPVITNATSWKVSAKVTRNANTCQSGFSFGPSNAKNGMLLFYVNAENAGLYTWDTFENGNGQAGFTVALSDAAKAAVKSADGYTLTLVAEGINGPKTGYLALYVNDIPVLVLENTFTSISCGHTGNVTVPLDLGNGHISLAVRQGGSSVTYTDYYMQTNCDTPLTLGTVTGNVVKLDGTTANSSFKLTSGQISKTVIADANGKFTVTLPLGTYTVTADGYRSLIGTVTVTAGTKDIGDIKLLQSLTADPMTWWDGGSLSESGNSATITPNTGDGNSMKEFNLGAPITNADSWRISATIQPGATYRRGFTIAPAGADKQDEMIFIWIEDGTAGFLTWNTFKDENEADIVWTYGFDSTLTQSAYDLTLVATNIDGAGTGWLSLYVNDTLVMRLENTFVGTGDRTAVGDKIDLGNVVVSLTATKPGNAVTFSDYYYRVNEETDLTVGTVSGKVTKLDGTAVPGKLSLTGGSIKKSVKVNADGTFSVTLPVGTYNIGAVEGYRGSISTITVAESNNADVELKLLQSLTADPMTWWDGGSLSESGNSATITPNSGSSNSMKEFNLGAPITNADSWRISATIQPGATYRRGFTIAPAGADKQDEMIFIWIEDGTAGFLTWNTFKDENEADIVWTYGFDSTLTQSAYDLTLVATNIDGAGTGWLSLYVNGTLVMRLENTFVGTGDRTAVGDKIDLGNVVVSLTATKPGNAVTFSDYYYRVNEETDLTVGTVNGNVTKLDGTTVPNKLSLTGGSIKKTVKVNADGTFSVTLPVDTYNIAAVEGYRGSISTITVAENNNADVELKLLQSLTLDGGWWGGGSYTESGNSATLTVSPYDNDNGHGDSGREVRVGSAITGATSWEIGAHINDSIAANYEARRGFSVGVNGTGATLFVFVDNLGYVGWYSWDTLEHTDYDATVYPHYQLQRYTMDATSAAAVQSGSFDMKLVATGINGAGTGTLTLYINDVQVLQFENKFEGHGGRLEKDVVVDLSQAALCLAVRRSGTVTTFSDYYTTYTTN